MLKRQIEHNTGKTGTFCCQCWHRGHIRTVVTGFGGNGVKLFCEQCQVLGDVQAVGCACEVDGPTCNEFKPGGTA